MSRKYNSLPCSCSNVADCFLEHDIVTTHVPLVGTVPVVLLPYQVKDRVSTFSAISEDIWTIRRQAESLPLPG